MKIQDLEIDRFGVWNGVRFTFEEGRMSVLYGPNEAGKSTLMRFIRGVLYGYLPSDEKTGGPQPKPVHCSGTLRVTHRGELYELRRESKPGTRGQLEINGRKVHDEDPLLKELTGDATEQLFQNIFAIGLHELQQLATLSGEEVASHIYGLSLGPEGEQLLRAHAGCDAEELRLAGDDGSHGHIHSLLVQLKDADEELTRRGQPFSRHSDLHQRLGNLEDEIRGIKKKQTQFHSNLRGYQFLSRVHAPWSRERAIRLQLERLPVDDLDREILDRLDAVEVELSQKGDERKSLIEEARKHQHDAEQIKTRPALEEQHCKIQNLFENSRKMAELEKSLDGRGQPQRSNTSPIQDPAFHSLISRLEGHWDQPRIEQAKVGPATMRELLKRARDYSNAGRSRARTVKRYKRGTTLLRKLQNDWRTVSQELGDQNPSEARRLLDRRLKEIEELRGLQLRKDHLQKTLELVGQQFSPTIVGGELPPFFWMILWMFVVGGLILFGAGAYAASIGYDGVVAGKATAWIVGACYTLLGACAIGTAYTMKRHFQAFEFHAPQRAHDRHALENELHRVEQAIQRLSGKPLPGQSPTALAFASQVVTDEEQANQIRQRLSQLGNYELQATRIERLRRKLSGMRQKLQERQRQLSRTRREWTEALRRLGLSETLKVSQAIEQCQLVGEAQTLIREWNASHHNVDLQRQELKAFLAQVDELATKIEGPGYHVRDPYALLSEWNREVQLLGERRRERNRLRQTAKEKRRVASKLQDKIENLRQQRVTLFKRLGVADRGEIAAKLSAIDERRELEQKLKGLRAELHKVAQTEPEMAIVEEDLLSFNEADVLSKIESLRGKLSEAEGLLEDKHEELGILKSQLREVEDDRTLTSLRFEREQILHSLKESLEQWYAAKLTDQLLSRLRHQLEKERQPKTLKAASEFLYRLTGGKYHNIWTPLDERALLVDDENGQSIRVQHLSSGTREQVFLAVRLAMIRDFGEQGVELPMILDDVTVNFDQTRTEAAVQTLQDVAERGQQILLFTCHQHLAHLFEAEGIEPVWLPAQRPEMQLQA
ncbi:MAG: AAA family ATPase [Planctomycetaceae bacterium]|nr:AAA family ATPase [Planctomycetaceae bacterium]